MLCVLVCMYSCDYLIRHEVTVLYVLLWLSCMCSCEQKHAAGVGWPLVVHALEGDCLILHALFWLY